MAKANGKAPPFPALKTELWPLARIKPYAKNARTHTEGQIAATRKAIDEYGWTYPILVDEKAEIIAGHRRLAAAMLDPPIAKVPVMVALGWSEDQKKAYRLWDNKSAIEGGWDEGLLRAELGELQAANFDLNLTGFMLSELNVFGDGERAGGGGQSSAGSLKEKFFAVPFSVFNAREGWWQDRKRAWLALGIQSEIGRGENLLKKSLHDQIALLVCAGNIGTAYQAGKDFIDQLRAEGVSDEEILERAQKVKADRNGKRAAKKRIEAAHA